MAARRGALASVSAGSSADDWELDGGDDERRDPRKFYVTASRGSENLGQVRVSARDVVLVQQILSQRLVPDYKTTQDFVRDAVHHRILELQELGVLAGALRMEVRLSEAEHAVAQMAERQRSYEATMDGIRDLFEKTRRDPTALMNLISQCLTVAQATNNQQREEALAMAATIQGHLATLPTS